MPNFNTRNVRPPIHLAPKIIYNISKELEEGVVGQEHAVKTLIRHLMKFYANVPLTKPIANLLFVGPTGVGKTHLVEEFANCIWRNSPETNGKAILKINCNEYQQHHEVARLIGAPPGYIGHRETPAVFEKARNLIPGGVILFDEIDKAHPDLFDVIMGIMDRGVISLSNSNEINFFNNFIIMTSNAGLKEFERPSIGFNNEKNEEEFSKFVRRHIEKTMRTEIFNRIDDVIVFNHLTETDIKKIINNNIKKFNENYPIANLNLSNSAVNFLIEQGYSKIYGARELNRVFEREIIFPMINNIFKSDFIKYLGNEEEEKPTISITVVNNEIKCKINNRAKSA